MLLVAANCAIHQKLDDSHFSKYLLPGHGSLVFDLSPRGAYLLKYKRVRREGVERKGRKIERGRERRLR